MSSVDKIKWAMSLRDPQYEALQYFDAISSKIEYRTSSKAEAEEIASENCQAPHTISVDKEFDFPSFCFDMTTGIGKSRLMGACIYYLYKTKGYKHFFILAPGNTIYDKMRREAVPGHPKYMFKGLEAEMGRPKVYDGENYLSYPVRYIQEEMVVEKTSDIQIFIFNISKIFTRGAIEFKFHKFNENLGGSFADVLRSFDDLVICMDEAHRYYAPASKKAINYLNPVLGLEYTAKLLLWVYVPPTSTVEKCINRIYDRNEDGDMDITDSPIQLQNMYNRKSNTYVEHKIFPYVTKDDLRIDLMDKVRNLAKSKNPDHQWLKMSDDEIMKSAGLWEKDFSSGIQGYNLAGVLLFGKDDVIRSCCPGYITDALYRVENLDRYDDRLQVTTNLIEAYYLLMEFVAKHTSDKFCLINNISTSIRGIISREVIGNILVHRDYSSAYPAKVIIEKDWLRTENWCIPRRHGNIMSDEFTPYPKNPLIQQFFANIGRTDTIGSGVRNLYKYTPMYSDGGKPELIEDDVFRINIPLDRIAADEATEQKTLSEREQKIYNMICENLHLSVEQVMAELDISRSTVFRDYAKIKKVTGAVYDKKTSTWTL